MLGEIEASLTAKRAEVDGTEELVLAFRLETTRAASRFVDARLNTKAAPRAVEAAFEADSLVVKFRLPGVPERTA